MSEILEQEDEPDGTIYLILDDKRGIKRTTIEEMALWNDINAALRKHGYDIGGLTNFKGICHHVHGIEQIIKGADDLVDS